MPGQHTIADIILAILSKVYVQDRRAFQQAARQRGISLEQVAAAAIAEAIYENPQLQERRN